MNGMYVFTIYLPKTVLSETLKGLTFYLIFKLASYPATVSWKLAEDKNLLRHRLATISLIAMVVARGSDFASVPGALIPRR